MFTPKKVVLLYGLWVFNNNISEYFMTIRSGINPWNLALLLKVHIVLKNKTKWCSFLTWSDGDLGCGKNVTLLHVMHYCLNNDWCIIQTPWRKFYMKSWLHVLPAKIPILSLIQLVNLMKYVQPYSFNIITMWCSRNMLYEKKV